MELLNKHIINKYIDGQISEDRYLYFNIISKTYKVHFLLISNECNIDNDTTLFLTKKINYLIEPYDINTKCYVYDDINKFNIDYNNIKLYNLTFDEYLNIFRKFVDLDNSYLNNTIIP